MNATKTKIWKYSWNPEGYEPSEVFIDTSDNLIGDVVKLPHTYFRADGLRAFVQKENEWIPLKTYAPNKKSIDILMVKRDEKLSNLAGTDIFSRLQINTKNARGKLKIIARFVADTMDNDSFNQDLHQDADVEHKSLTIKTLLATNKADIEGPLVVEKMRGPWGVINEEEVNLKAPTLSIGTAISITPEKVTLNTNRLFTKNGGEFKYDNVSKRWKSFNEPIVTFNGDLNTVKDVGLPVCIGNPTALTFVPWIDIDLPGRALVVENIKIGNVVLTAEDVAKLKQLISPVEDPVNG